MPKNKLLSAQQMLAKYLELGEDYPWPYTYKLNKGGQVLYFLGCNHSNDPANSQFPRVKQHWDDFLAETKSSNCLVMVEGWSTVTKPTLKPIPYDSEAAAIKRSSEGGLVVYLANRAGIPYYSPEPDVGWEMNELAQQFGRDELMYYYFVRQALQWHRDRNQADFESYLQPFLDGYQHASGWKDYDFSFEHMTRLHDQWHHHKLHPDDGNCFKHDSDPAHNVVATSNIRDEHIVDEIKKHWGEGKNIFIAYGSGHAIVQEPALKNVLEGRFQQF